MSQPDAAALADAIDEVAELLKAAATLARDGRSVGNTLAHAEAQLGVVSRQADDSELEVALCAAEGKGWRIVNAGQTDPLYMRGRGGSAPWAISDYRTGEVLASGRADDAEVACDAIEAAWRPEYYSLDALLGDLDDGADVGSPDG